MRVVDASGKREVANLREHVLTSGNQDFHASDSSLHPHISHQHKHKLNSKVTDHVLHIMHNLEIVLATIERAEPPR